MEVKEVQGQPGDALDIRRLALNSGNNRRTSILIHQNSLHQQNSLHYQQEDGEEGIRKVRGVNSCR